MAGKSMWGGGDYDFLMGRWSRLMAPKLVEFAGAADGNHVLDIGCGTGSLTGALLGVGPNVRVVGIDASPDFVDTAREAIRDGRARFKQANAQNLPLEDNMFDRCASLLVMNFIPEPDRALAEMRRVTRPGGTIAAAVWDYSDGMEMLRVLWDEAVALERDAEAKHERHMPLCRPGQLSALWGQGGLEEIDETGLTIEMAFESFEDYWAPFLTGIGPSGAYVVGLDPRRRAVLRERLSNLLAPEGEDKPFRLPARAWAVRGRTPD